KVVFNDTYFSRHIEQILALPLVDPEAIRKAGFRAVLDAVNSTGALVVPRLLKELGVAIVDELYCTVDAQFPHDPEPLAHNLTDLSAEVVRRNAGLGIVVDPDVHRPVFVCDDGSLFGEEHTLVPVADYVLFRQPANT